ncbi:cytochrome P450 [Nocardia terpenica]|uniref:Cytochrome P450 n=1 Tax=Nocardia terpenica TaxID=455432 RepID=A0A6G9ZB12_9NOCA|nr:cytochrome P450 [Nocardia terpenica]QIS22600.1 cytochrome P450 [Nocardia terpenica]
MTESLSPAIELPVERPPGRPFDPAAGLAAIREREPLTRLKFPGGHVGWLATGHAVVRAVLADPRFSSRSEYVRSPVVELDTTRSVPAGMFLRYDPPQHTRFRNMLTGRFTVRRMRLLTERIEGFTAECLDAMERQGGPVDLVTAFARPIPELVICDLLGVPVADHDQFSRLAAASTPDVSPEELVNNRIDAFDSVLDYIRHLVAAKRANPTDDMLSELAATDLTEDELVGVGGLLLAAGLDTTANMLALGTFALLCNPEQLALLRADPDLTDRAVEELLRYLSIAHTAVRGALEDVELAGHTIKAGESVALSITAGNRDPERFDDPDTLDVERNAVGHLAFGHGVHQCLGQQLARVEMRVGYRALLARFPGLRLAVPADEVPLRGAIDIGGVRSLPVTW